MELWKYYHLISAVFICTANAESIEQMTNSRIDGKQVKTTPMLVYPTPDVANTNENNEAYQLHKDSRDLFGNGNRGTEFEGVFPHSVQNISSNNTFIKGSSFNAKLFEMLASAAHHTNLVFSPLSLQTLLTFIFSISGGKLYEELTQVLELPNNQPQVAQVFENILKTAAEKAPPTSLIMANKLYYDYRYGPVELGVQSLAKHSFASELEQMDFTASNKAANDINAWVRERTRNLIQNIVTPATITSDTTALLLNSIYFKSEWLIKFDLEDTEILPFYVSERQQVPVDMMYNEDVFRYGDFTEDLQATAVELPYNATNLTMLLILPKQVAGLAALEGKLRNYDLETLERKLKREIVTVKLPRFKIEYETDMVEILQKLGLNALFNNEGVINLFQNQRRPLKVDQFKHKAFINVNEAGTEAAAVSVAKYIPLSIPVNIKHFTADHPFVFIIKDGPTILFMGHVTQF